MRRAIYSDCRLRKGVDLQDKSRKKKSLIFRNRPAISIKEEALSVAVIGRRNENGETSSNSGRGCLCFIPRL